MTVEQRGYLMVFAGALLMGAGVGWTLRQLRCSCNDGSHHA